MKICLTLCIFLLAAINGYCQDSLINEYLRNSSLKYDVLLQTRSLVTKKNPPGATYHVVIDMPRDIRKKLLRKKFDFWQSKLDSDSTDWASNLVLYYLYDRDAIAVTVVKDDRRKWLSIKEREIKYWKDFLDKK
jgi:hypothetical protein